MISDQHLNLNQHSEGLKPLINVDDRGTAQVLIFLHCHLEGRIPLQIVMVIQIFISLAQGVEPLPQQVN